jgi:hypothetical protein
MQSKVKEKIKSYYSKIHNKYVGREQDRLRKIKEDLEEQKQVIIFRNKI